MSEKKHFLYLGAHMSIAGGFQKAIEEGASIGCTTVQIFTKNNRQWHAKPITHDEIVLFQETLQKSSISSVIAHTSYLINIGSALKNIEEKSYQALVEELYRCEQLKIKYLVLHPGAHLDSTVHECINRIAYNLDRALAEVPGNVCVLLENSAGQGTSVGYTLEQLAEIKQKTINKNRIFFCFDTCHAFAVGYNFQSEKTYFLFWSNYDNILGIKNLKAIHINDSQKEIGSRVDRHEHIGKGRLGLEAFKLLFNDYRFFDIPKILETPKEKNLKDDIKNMKTIKELLSQETKNYLNFNE